MKKKRKKHKHRWEWEEPCNACGYQEAYCKNPKCHKTASRQGWKGKIEID